MVRIGVLADLHYPVPSAGEVTAALDDAFSWFDDRGVETAFVLGDLVQETGSRDEDVQNLSALADYFSGVSQTCLPIMGNHDILAVRDREFEDVLGVSRRGTRNVGGVTCIRCDTPLRGAGEPHAGILGPERRESLLETVRSAETAIVFSHHPLYHHDISDNPWFATRPEHVFCLDRSRIEPELLDGASGALATLNGHTHQRDVTRKGHGLGVTVNPFSKHRPDDDSVYGAATSVDVDGSRLRIVERNVVSETTDVLVDRDVESSAAND